MICIAEEPTGYLPVSVCLLSYKRPQNMQRIVDSLHDHACVDEILVWNNNADVDLLLHGDKVRIIQSPENMIGLGRYLCARQARNDVIYVQDDDVVRNFPDLYESFLADSSRITHALKQRHYRQQQRYQYADSQDALLGWGAFFKKEWISVLDAYLDSAGDSALLRREADKFFALLLGRHHQALPAELEILADESTRGIALWREEEHKLLGALAVRSALAYMRASRSVPFPVTRPSAARTGRRSVVSTTP